MADIDKAEEKKYWEIIWGSFKDSFGTMFGIFGEILADAYLPNFRDGSSNILDVFSVLLGVNGNEKLGILGKIGSTITYINVILDFYIAANNKFDELHEELTRKWDNIELGNETVNIAEYTKNIESLLQLEEEAQRERIEKILSINEEYSKLQDLAEQYWNLSNKTSLTNKENDKLKEVSNELIRVFPELKDEYDEVTGKILTEKDALDELIKTKKEEVLIDTAKKYLKNNHSIGGYINPKIAEISGMIGLITEDMNNLGKEIESKDSMANLQEYHDEISALDNHYRNLVNWNNRLRDFYEGLEAEGKVYEDIKAGNSNSISLENFKYQIDEVKEADISELLGLNINKILNDGDLSNIANEAADSTMFTFVEKLFEWREPANNAIEEFLTNITDIFNDKKANYSPVEAADKTGSNTVLAFISEIINGFGMTTTTMDTYVGTITGGLEKLPISFFSMGQLSIVGLIIGLTTMEPMLYHKANSIANNLRTIMSSALLFSDVERDDYGISRSFYGNLIIPNNLAYTGINTIMSVFTSELFQEDKETSYSSVIVNEIVPRLVEIVQYAKESAGKEFSFKIGERDIVKTYQKGKKMMGRSIMSE